MQSPISLCISVFESTGLWQQDKCQQRVQSQHGGADRRFVPRHKEAGCGRDQDFSDSCATQPHTCSMYVPGFCSLLEQPALLTVLAQHPASRTPCFCLGTVQNSPADISCSLFLYSSSQGCPSPNSASQRCSDPFCSNHVAWPRPGSISALPLGSALPDPPAKARVSSSFGNRAAHLELSSHCWPGWSASSSPLSDNQPVAKG